MILKISKNNITNNMDNYKKKIFKIDYNNYIQNGSSLQVDSKIEVNIKNISNKFNGLTGKLEKFKKSINENNKL